MPIGAIFRTANTTATNATDVTATVEIPEIYYDGTYAVVCYGCYYPSVNQNATFVTMWLENVESNTFPDPDGMPLGDFILRSTQPGSGTTAPSYGAEMEETFVPIPIMGSQHVRLRMSVYNQNNGTPGIRGFIILRRFPEGAVPRVV